MPDAGATGRRVARGQRQVIPTVENEIRHGTVTAVAFDSGRAKLSIDIEGQGGAIPGIYALGHYLGPKVDDHVLVVGNEANWTCLGTVTDAGSPLVVLERAAQSIASGGSGSVIGYAPGEVEIDTHGWFDDSTNRITPTIAGWYRYTVGIGFDAADNATRVILAPRKNTVGLASRTFDAVYGSAVSAGVSVAGMVDLNGSTDFFDSLLFHSGGSNPADVATQTTFELVRPA